MKKTLLGCAILMLAATSCEKKITTTIDQDGDRTTVETVGLDKERIDSTAEKVSDKIEVAAKKTGDALEKTGENIKDEVDKSNTKEEQKEKVQREPTNADLPTE